MPIRVEHGPDLADYGTALAVASQRMEQNRRNAMLGDFVARLSNQNIQAARPIQRGAVGGGGGAFRTTSSGIGNIPSLYRRGPLGPSDIAQQTASRLMQMHQEQGRSGATGGFFGGGTSQWMSPQQRAPQQSPYSSYIQNPIFSAGGSLSRAISGLGDYASSFMGSL